LSQDFWGQDDLVLESENELLVAPFSEVEIKEAVWSYYADGALGPDGLSFMFIISFGI